jgi:cAMP-dependent protein kinase regulator
MPKDKETTESIKNKIMQSFMFGNLKDSDIAIVIDAMKVVTVKAGDMVIKEGDSGDELYLVGSGKYTCTKTFPGDSNPTHLRYYKPGEAFGELWLLYNCPRAASIQTLEEGTLYALDRATFNHIVKDAACRRRERYEEFLISIELFQGMERYERVSLADGVVEFNYKAGDYIIKQGDLGDRFYFIFEGEAVATKRLEYGKAPIEVMQYFKGSYFGELSLINDAPRAANVIAKTDWNVLSIDIDTFKRVMGSADDLLQRNYLTYYPYLEEKLSIIHS